MSQAEIFASLLNLQVQEECGLSDEQWQTVTHHFQRNLTTSGVKDLKAYRTREVKRRITRAFTAEAKLIKEGLFADQEVATVAADFAVRNLLLRHLLYNMDGSPSHREYGRKQKKPRLHEEGGDGGGDESMPTAPRAQGRRDRQESDDRMAQHTRHTKEELVGAEDVVIKITGDGTSPQHHMLQCVGLLVAHDNANDFPMSYELLSLGYGPEGRAMYGVMMRELFSFLSRRRLEHCADRFAVELTLPDGSTRFVKVRIVVCADQKWLLFMLGLGACYSEFSCPHCTMCAAARSRAWRPQDRCTTVLKAETGRAGDGTACSAPVTAEQAKHMSFCDVTQCRQPSAFYSDRDDGSAAATVRTAENHRAHGGRAMPLWSVDGFLLFAFDAVFMDPLHLLLRFWDRLLIVLLDGACKRDRENWGAAKAYRSTEVNAKRTPALFALQEALRVGLGFKSFVTFLRPSRLARLDRFPAFACPIRDKNRSAGAENRSAGAENRSAGAENRSDGAENRSDGAENRSD